MVAQFIKVGDLFINTVDIKQVYREKQEYTNLKKYTLQLRDGKSLIVPSCDSNTFETWLFNNSLGF